MPTLEFKGKQHIYAHHLTVPYRPLVSDVDRSLNPGGTDDNLIIHLLPHQKMLPSFSRLLIDAHRSDVNRSLLI